MAKQKRVVKKKEEVLEGLRKNQDFNKKMEFVKGTFYPALLNCSYSIEDTTTFLSSLSTMIMQEFLQTMKEKKMIDLKLESKLDAKDEKHEEYVALVNIFNDMSLYEAKEMVEGMKAEVQLFINEELKDRPLSSLATKWIDELDKK